MVELKDCQQQAVLTLVVEYVTFSPALSLPKSCAVASGVLSSAFAVLPSLLNRWLSLWTLQRKRAEVLVSSLPEGP
jgi:hypothetical protein